MFPSPEINSANTYILVYIVGAAQNENSDGNAWTSLEKRGKSGDNNR
jgi:hypothetical protein